MLATAHATSPLAGTQMHASPLFRSSDLVWFMTSRDTVASSVGTHQAARTILGFHLGHGDISISITLDDATEELRDGSEDVLLVVNVRLGIL